jgi:tetratricopeptide (TPR) repeat protein
MTPPTDRNPEFTEKRTYWCFISYRHSDNKHQGRQWATWLHQAIESYEVPADLVGQKNERGEIIPERIFPVFRDEEELPVDADLASPIYRALDNSKYLIAICSPRAVESSYVASEIRYFKQLGRENNVLAAIIDGEPNAFWDQGKQSHGFTQEQECFPEPLRHRIDPSGTSMGKTEPIAADLRLNDGSQGWTSPEAYRQALRRSGHLDGRTLAAKVEDYRKRSELMKLKIIAGILGVALGTLTKRDAAYQLALARKRARNLLRWLAAVGVLMALAVAGGVVAIYQRNAADTAKVNAQQQQLRAELGEKKAKKSRDQAEDILNFMLFDLKNQLAPIGKLAIMDGVQKKVSAYYQNMGVEEQEPDQIYQRNVALDNQGALLLEQGKLPEALAAFEQSLASRNRTQRSATSSPNAQADVADSLIRIGGIYTTQNRLAEALAAFEEALALRRQLVKSDPANGRYQADLAASLNHVGICYDGESKDPLPLFEEALVLRKHLVERDPSNGDWQAGLGDSLDRLGVYSATRGKIPEAVSFHQEHVALIRRVLQQHPTDTRWQDGLGFALNRIGSFYLEQRQLGEALTAYEEALDIWRSLTQIDPTNTRWLSRLRLCLMDLSTVYRLQGKFVEEKGLNDEANRVIRTLALADPFNPLWQSSYAGSVTSQGLILQSKREFAAAIPFHRQAEEVLRRLVANYPSDAKWQSDLAVVLNQLGICHQRLKQYPEALGAFRDSTSLFRRLSKNDASNTKLQREVADCLSGAGTAFQSQDNLTESRKTFEESVEIYRPLMIDGPSGTDSQSNLADALFKLGDAYLSANRTEAARIDDAIKALDESLSLRRRAQEAAPADLLAQMVFKDSLLKLGDAYQTSRKYPEALKSFQECVTFSRNLSDKAAGWGRVLVLSINKLGSVYQNIGDPDKTIETYSESVKLAYHLSQADLSSSQARRDFLASLSGISQAHLSKGENANALPYLKEKKKVVSTLLAKEGRLPDLEGELEWLNLKIPWVEKNLAPARK